MQANLLHKMANDDTSSVVSSEIDSSSDVENIVLEEPMFYVLNQFLRTEDGTNIATCVQELTAEVRELKKLLSSFVKAQISSQGNAQ
jgi:hypothetical protein